MPPRLTKGAAGLPPPRRRGHRRPSPTPATPTPAADMRRRQRRDARRRRRRHPKEVGEASGAEARELAREEARGEGGEAAARCDALAAELCKQRALELTSYSAPHSYISPLLLPSTGTNNTRSAECRPPRAHRRPLRRGVRRATAAHTSTDASTSPPPHLLASSSASPPPPPATDARRDELECVSDVIHVVGRSLARRRDRRATAIQIAIPSSDGPLPSLARSGGRGSSRGGGAQKESATFDGHFVRLAEIAAADDGSGVSDGAKAIANELLEGRKSQWGAKGGGNGSEPPSPTSPKSPATPGKASGSEPPSPLATGTAPRTPPSVGGRRARRRRRR